MDGDKDALNESLADIDHDLHRIFTQHPDSHLNDAGDPVIPADALVDVFQAFADIYNGLQLLSREEMDMLKALLASNPGLEVTPQILMDFIAEKTKHAPSRSPADDNVANQDAERPPEDPSSDESNGSIGGPASSHSRPPSRGGSTKYSPFDAERRQRTQPLTSAPSSWNSRRPPPASRRKSIDAGSRSDSDSFSTSPNVFHRSSGRRSRAPSNPTPPTFSPIGSPAPPSSFHGLSFSGSGSYSRPSSRNAHHSHSSSQPTFGSFQFGSPSASSHMDDSYYRSGQSTPDESLSHSASSLYDYHGRRLENSFVRSTSGRSSVSPLPALATNLDGGILDHRNDLTSADLSDMSGSSDEEEDSALGLVMDKTVNAGAASLKPIERMDALQRANTELGRKLLEAEGTLQRKLLEHESELEEMQSKLDEMRAELGATKREEKELRSKERQNTTQIAALEAEIAKVTRALDHARATYTNLQKQYQEQCIASEKYRDDLRIREEVIRTLRDAATLHELEAGKWAREQDSYEERIAHLEAELTIAQQAHVQLDEQKQENLLLKETIDRMRYEMDEMRSGLNLGLHSGTLGLPGSGRGTISKSLGDELVGKLKWEDEEASAVSREGQAEDEDEEEEGSSFNSGTAVELDGESGEEDVIQTIITKRKRKIASRANKTEVFTTQLFEENKEYSDSSTQYDPSYFFSTGVAQTDLEPERPKVTTASVDIQTELLEPSHPSLPRTEFAIQVDVVEEKKVKGVAIDASIPDPLPRVMVETDVQTEGVETDDPEEQEHDDSLASSSSTIKPPTPRPITPAPIDTQTHYDEPPAYSSATSAAESSSIALGLGNEEKEWRMAAELLKKWHRGAKLPIDGIPGGVSEEAAAEWRTLKEELGVECMVIDKIMERSARVPAVARSPPGEAETDSATGDSSTQGTVSTSVSRAGRFYNIYNTYVYGAGSGVHHHHGEDGKPSMSSSFPTSFVVSTLTSLARQAAMWAGASAAVLFFMGPYLAAAPYGVGPTYFDRQVWNSFNALHAGAGEGFVGPAGRFGGGWFGFGAGGAGGVVAGGGGGAVDGTAAVWSILGRVGGGAARIARGWPT